MNGAFVNVHGELEGTTSTLAGTFTLIPSTTTIVNDPDIEDQKVVLLPDTLEGTSVFSGTGVVGDTLFVEVAGLGDIDVTHVKTDIFGCSTQDTKTITILDPSNAIPGLNTTFCVDKNAVTVTTLGFTAGTLFNHRLDKLIIENPVLPPADDGIDFISGSFVFDPKVPGVGTYDFLATYFNLLDANDSSEIPLTVEIFELPVVSLTLETPSPLDTLEYCENGGLLEFTGSPLPGFNNLGVFTTDLAATTSLTDNGDGTATLDLAQAAADFTFTPATLTITYTFTDVENNSCVVTDNVVIDINPKPVGGFSLVTSCEDIPVQFTDISSISAGTVDGWNYDFDDSDVIIENQTSLLQDPSHLFSAVGTFNVELTAISNFGCLSDVFTTPVLVGSVPEADFTLVGVNDDDVMLFTDASTITAPATIDQLVWDFGDGTPIVTNNNPNTDTPHDYDVRGVQTVTLIAFTDAQCPDTVQKTVIVVDRIVDNNYLEDFESGRGGWLTTAGSDSWDYGTPTNKNTNIKLQNFNGNRIWITNLDGPYLSD